MSALQKRQCPNRHCSFPLPVNKEHANLSFSGGCRGKSMLKVPTFERAIWRSFGKPFEITYIIQPIGYGLTESTLRFDGTRPTPLRLLQSG